MATRRKIIRRAPSATLATVHRFVTSSPAGRRSGPEQAVLSQCSATNSLPKSNARLGGSPADISLNPAAQVEVSRPAYIAVMNIRVEVIVWLKDLLPGVFLGTN